MAAVIHFIYTGEFKNESVCDIALFEVYVLADYICLEEFRETLVEKIKNGYFTVEKIFELLHELKESGLPLRDEACKWFKVNKDAISKCDGYLDKLRALLSGVDGASDLNIALM